MNILEKKWWSNVILFLQQTHCHSRQMYRCKYRHQFWLFDYIKGSENKQSMLQSFVPLSSLQVYNFLVSSGIYCNGNT